MFDWTSFRERSVGYVYVMEMGRVEHFFDIDLLKDRTAYGVVPVGMIGDCPRCDHMVLIR